MYGVRAEHLVFVITLIIKLHSLDEQTVEAPATLVLVPAAQHMHSYLMVLNVTFFCSYLLFFNLYTDSTYLFMVNESNI